MYKRAFHFFLLNFENIFYLPFFIHSVTRILTKMPEKKEELLAAGLSSEAADGIIKITEEAEAKGARMGPPKNGFDFLGRLGTLLTDLDTFIKTKSKQDQEAYKKVMEKKKAEWEAAAKK
ncbi:Protein CBG22879 [Caenorhabditis briggsae]|uniref:Protein CBG22879 n=1 Tax=Caenorhabditis briggsae TaxID=6238 RepID=A8Y3A1_CAEBR|nr:Protein CBG22879 [Caenorhabditis briggsae]CAP39370.2 Protein CBG22879 [Caenorhabditis briggsae]